MQLSKLGAEYSRLLDSLPASETQVLQAARSLEIGGDADNACAFLHDATQRYPSVLLRKALAALHLKHGRFEQSAHVIGEALEDAPGDVPAMLLLAEAQINCGRHQSAAKILARAERYGASKLRIFKLERQIDEAPTTPHVSAAGPTPPLDDREFGGDPSDSSVFEDGSFSNLSSFELAEGASALDDDSASVFDTLVDGYDDDPADRAFDDLLMDLGVPVDDEAPTDPNRTGSMLLKANDEVADQWGLGQDDGAADPEEPTAAISVDRLPRAVGETPADEGRPRYHTPRFQESPEFQKRKRQHNGQFQQGSRQAPRKELAEDAFPDEKTGILDFEQPSPTKAERPSAHKAASQRQARPQAPDDWLLNNQNEARGDDQHRSQPERYDERPLPPSVQGGRQSRSRPTGQSRAVAAPPVENSPRAKRDASPGTNQPGTSQPGTNQLGTNQSGPSKSGRNVPLKYAVPGAVVVGLLVIAGIALAASASAADAVVAHLDTYRSVTATDTYQGYLRGEQALEQALRAESFLGASADAAFASVGLMGQANAARHEALAELAKLDAMVEYRFERIDTRQSLQSIERAEQQLAGDPRLDVARGYRLLAAGRPEEAAETLEATRKTFPTFADAATALIHAYLDDDSLQSASMTATVLRELESPSVHQHYVLGLLESRQGKDAADARLRHLIETLSPEHISARIARSYTLRKGGDDESLDEAAALLDEVLGPLRERTSPMQRADAHIALGELFVQRDERARAEEQFRKAIKVLPSRSSVYGPLIALYRDDGRLDKSIELIDDAVAQGARSPDLLLGKAAILRLTGEADAALRLIEKEELESARAHWLEGMALLDKTALETATLEQAAKAFAAAVDKNEEFAPARAYRLSVDELGSSEERDGYSEELGSLLEKFSTDPQVLRAGALAAMRVATITNSRTSRQELLDEAKTSIEQALGRGGSQAVLLFDLCRQQMLAGDGQNASISCRKARRVGATYLPGLLTMADLERRRGNPDAAVELLDELAKRFADEPRISQLKADALIDRFDVEAAEAEINRWAGTEAAKSTLHWLVEGRLAFAKERYTSALGYFQRAHNNDPSDARAGLYYAQTLTRLGEHERAEKLVKEYLTDLEWEPVAWLVFGEVRRRQGRFSDARENLDLALGKLRDSIAPPWRTSEAYTQLALAWADRYGFDHRFVGRYLYRGADRGDDNDPALNAARGRYHLEKRRPDREKAAEAFEKVIEVKPFDCSALGSLRSLYDGEVERVESLYAEHCKD